MPSNPSNPSPIVRRSKLLVSIGKESSIGGPINSKADALVLTLAKPFGSLPRLERSSLVNHNVGLLSSAGRDLFGWVSTNSAEDLYPWVTRGITGLVAAAESSNEIRVLDTLIGEIEAEKGLPSGMLQIDLILKSTDALLNSYESAVASPRVVSLNIDETRLAKELGVELSYDEDPLAYARGRIIVTAALADVQAHGLGFLPATAKHLPLTETRAIHARQLGFTGSFCSTTQDVASLNFGFSPSQEELDRALAVTAAMEEGIKKGLGAVSLGGNEMIDIAMMRHAYNTIRRMEAVQSKQVSQNLDRHTVDS